VIVSVPVRVTSCHWLLLRLAGTAPDELISQCRRWLGRRRTLDVARTVAHAVLSQRIRLTDTDVDLLAELLAAAGLDTSGLSMVSVTDTDPMPAYCFSPSRARIPGHLPAADLPPQRPDARGEPEDHIDEVFLRAIDRSCLARAGWRCWRYAAGGAPWPRPRRVYLVETDTGVDLARVTWSLQAVLTGAGEPQPQVEVYPTRAQLPSYQRLARAGGALLWARDEDPGVRVAVPFDPARAVASHRSWSPETHLLVAYLYGGDPLLTGSVPLDDAVDPGRAKAVPARLLTDGLWIWEEAWAYYLERYGIPPEAELVAHIRNRRYQLPLVDGAALHRALAALPEPGSDQPHWTGEA
jgi:hypothetical protein